jgi:predicted RNA-binding Zn ribbon-like protein
VNPALELVNSEWWRGRAGGLVDKLADAEWMRDFAAELGVRGRPTTRQLRELHELRGILRRLVESAGRDVSPLDRYVAKAPVRRRVRRGELVLEPVARDWGWAISEIASSYIDLVAHGEPERIKVCANDECQWSFYDESKNRSRRWCGAPSCGTADKVRRFRARRRAAVGS